MILATCAVIATPRKRERQSTARKVCKGGRTKSFHGFFGSPIFEVFGLDWVRFGLGSDLFALSLQLQGIENTRAPHVRRAKADGVFVSSSLFEIFGFDWLPFGLGLDLFGFLSIGFVYVGTGLIWIGLEGIGNTSAPRVWYVKAGRARDSTVFPVLRFMTERRLRLASVSVGLAFVCFIVATSRNREHYRAVRQVCDGGRGESL